MSVDVDGIPTTNLAQTLVQLGAVVESDQVEQALDDVLRRKVSPVWIEQTLESMWRPGPTGAGVLLEILRDPRRAGRLPDSWFERLTERLMTAPELPVAERQFEVVTARGRRRLDLAYPGVKLGIEAHSRRFHFGPGREEEDGRRDLELAAAGWEILHVTWGMAHEPDLFVPLVVDARRARRHQFGDVSTHTSAA